MDLWGVQGWQKEHEENREGEDWNSPRVTAFLTETLLACAAACQRRWVSLGVSRVFAVWSKRLAAALPKEEPSLPFRWRFSWESPTRQFRFQDVTSFAVPAASARWRQGQAPLPPNPTHGSWFVQVEPCWAFGDTVAYPKLAIWAYFTLPICR